MSTAVVEPYNAVLTTHASMDHSDVTFLGMLAMTVFQLTRSNFETFCENFGPDT